MSIYAIHATPHRPRKINALSQERPIKVFTDTAIKALPVLSKNTEPTSHGITVKKTKNSAFRLYFKDNGTTKTTRRTYFEVRRVIFLRRGACSCRKSQRKLNAVIELSPYHIVGTALAAVRRIQRKLKRVPQEGKAVIFLQKMTEGVFYNLMYPILTPSVSLRSTAPSSGSGTPWAFSYK